MTQDRLVLLITRQMSGELDPEETRELELWAAKAPENRRFLDQFSNEVLLEKEIAIWNNIDPAQGYNRWIAYRQSRRRLRILRFSGWSVAASLLLAVVIGDLIGRRHLSKRVAPAVAMKREPVMPGKNTAILTLSNGQQLVLDSVSKGELGIQGNSRLIKADSGSLSYLPSGGDEAATIYNTLTTPKAGQYQLTLPDGTRVWLNNVSSIRYPTSFKGKDRMVELTGEAYFEIAKDAARPFIVKVRDELVQVLGTSFNIMSYPEEGGTQTTLLTGEVRVKTAAGAAVELKPDQQAEVKTGGKLIVLKDVPSQDIVSWKNGFFYFGRASFGAVMRQLARWYDVEVVYEGKMPDVEFGGKIDRSVPLDDLLKFLDKNQIHFRLEGQKLIVLPN
jgi:transmembrane sensor